MKNFFVSSTLRYLTLLYGTLGLAFGSMYQQAVAEEPLFKATLIGSNHHTSESNQESKVKKPQFPDRGIPTGRRRGGTSRSECHAANGVLTAIVPGRETKETNVTSNHNDLSFSKFLTQVSFTNSQSFLSQTLKRYPTFWIYIPELTSSFSKGEFILQDDEDNDIYRADFNLPNRAGIINISLPNQPQNSLKIGQKYHWYVKIFCGESNKKADYIFVDAWIERIALTPKLKRQLDNKDTHRYQILVDHNVWYDAIDNLAKIQQTSEYKKTHWQQLLTVLRLSDLIEKNVIDLRASSLVK